MHMLQIKHSGEVELNKQLKAMMPKQEQEVRLIREVPQRLAESVGNFKDTFEEVLSVLQVKAVQHVGFFESLFA